MDYTLTILLCELSKIDPQQPECNPRVYHFQANDQTLKLKYSDDYSTVNKNVDLTPFSLLK